ncbi:MAG TPA: VIT1/CCC1 transporter family protein [Mycobacteriales bacterium]
MTTPTRTFGGVKLPPVHHHRDIQGGALRPALFGAMDGLVSNGSLIAGVAGSGATTHMVALTALAGLVAGAFSMAVGEYTSVRAQEEATLNEVALERLELRRAPASEQAELAAAYVARGLTPDLAQQVAAQLSQDPEVELRVHTQEELGVDIDNLPSPWTASGSSFVAFSIGAVVPAAPYFFGLHLLWLALLLGAVGLFAAGAAVSRFTGKPYWLSGGRQLLLGAVAAAVTFGIGHLVGAGLS